MDRRIAEIRWLLDRVPFEPDAAARLLAIAADYVEQGKRMPLSMRAWLATGLRAGAEAEEGTNGLPIEHERSKAMAMAFGIVRKAGAPTKFVSWRDVRRTVLAFGSVVSETVLSAELAKAYGVGKTTARNHVKSAKARLKSEQQHLY